MSTAKGHDRVMGQWEGMLRFMLADYRARRPDDPRSDRELLESLMERFVRSGLVEKRDGKYVLPEIV
jgi:hypothetical protein